MKTNNLYIGFGALGSALHFKKVAGYNGTADYLATIKILLANPSISKLGLFSRNDWEKLSDAEKLEIDPHNKIYNPWKGLPSLGKLIKEENSFENQRDFVERLWIVEKENIPDFMIAYMSMGMMTSATIPLLMHKRRPPYDWPKILMSTLSYAGPINYYISMSKVPWLMIGTDPRYFPTRMSNRDCFNLPLEILGQYNSNYRWEHLDDDQTTEVVDYIDMHYAEVEKHRLYREKITSPRNIRKNKFSIVAMQSSAATATKDNRFNEIKNWVLKDDTSQECSIYGKWSDYFMNQYPVQFKGMITPTELDKIMIETRYTLIIPVRKNWATYKYAEMLKSGVLPFFHPSYDSQYHIIPKDHILRVSSSEDMFKKMEIFDNQPEKRYSIIEELQKTLIIPATKGDYFYRRLNESFNRNNIDIRLVEHEHKKIRNVKLKQTSLF